MTRGPVNRTGKCRGIGGRDARLLRIGIRKRRFTKRLLVAQNDQIHTAVFLALLRCIVRSDGMVLSLSGYLNPHTRYMVVFDQVGGRGDGTRGG